MAKRKTGGTKFPSTSTPGHLMELSSWLVELALTRENKGIRLPEKFWNHTKYKFRFKREIMAVRKFLAEITEKEFLRLVEREYLTTYTDYAAMQVFVQQTKEKVARLASPKDTSEVKTDGLKEGPDLRNFKLETKKNKNLFDRIKELEDVNTTLSN